MKVSLKVREERSLLVRTKLPLNVLGLPLFTGVTSGDPNDLALHLGTYLQVGPAFRFSYRPNNVFSPFAVHVKTGFVLGSSPNGAGFALSAEFDVNCLGAPSFSLRVKPKFGDFGLKKHTQSFTASFNKTDINGDEILSGERTNSGERLERQESGVSAMHTLDESALANQNGLDANGYLYGKNVTGLGIGSGEPLMEMVACFSNGTDGKTDSFISGGKPKEIADRPVKQFSKGSSDGDGCMAVYDEQGAESMGNAATIELSRSEKVSKGGQDKSWLSGFGKGWSISARSSLPLGKRAVAKVRWHVTFGSNLFHDPRHGLRVTDINLPALTVDKVTFEALDTFKSLIANPSPVGTDFGVVGFAYPNGNASDETELGRIMASCASIRYQLQLLHSENNVLRNMIDELRGDLANRKSAVKGTDLMVWEDNVLRSQMFDELNRIVNGSSRGTEDTFSKGISKDGKSYIEKPGSSSAEDFTINVDPSEELKKAIMHAGGR